MSTGNMIMGGVGFGLGWLMGNPMMGAGLGGMIGSWLFPYKPPTPPMSELSINSYVRDIPVPVVFGQDKVAGGVVWIGKNSCAEVNSGKSKMPVWVTVYSAQFAVAVSEGEITQFLHYYLNDQIIQDINPEYYINLHFSHHLGNTTDGIESDIASFLAKKHKTPFNTHINNDLASEYNMYPYTSTPNLFYADFSSYPIGFFNESYGVITHTTNGVATQYEFVVIDQEQYYCVIGSQMPFTPSNGDAFYVVLNTNIIDAWDSKAVPWRNTAYVNCWGQIGKQNSLPSFAAEIVGLVPEAGQQESNPIVALYTFLTNKRWGAGLSTSLINGNPTDGTSTWYAAAQYCNVQIPVDIVGLVSSMESRFLYSQTFDSPTKGYDIIKDILQTCRGFIYQNQGLLEVLIENSEEPTVFYFSDGYRLNRITGENSTSSVLYADFSTVPINFFAGDVGEIVTNGSSHPFFVVSQDASSITLGDALLITPNEGDAFFVLKDNIKKQTFNYVRKATFDSFNRVRVNYKNRLDDYRDDYVETDDVYDINNTNQIRINTVSIKGIKRQSQAARMASFLQDFNSYVNYTIDFQTDIVGYMFNIGQIIGVHSNVCNWGIKTFRIMSISEEEDYETKIHALEYVPNIYHDDNVPYQVTESYKMPNYYSQPDNVSNFLIFEDTEKPQLIITFLQPDVDSDNNTYWSGANLYCSVDGGQTYVFEQLCTFSTPSVALLNAIGTSDTNIAYNPTTMNGSFPASGSFWIQNSDGTAEEIAYDEIDDINFQFLGCTRGYNQSLSKVHAQAELMVLRSNQMNTWQYNTNNQVGLNAIFQLISVTMFGISANSNSAPTETIDIHGLALLPPMPGYLQLNGISGSCILSEGEDAVLTWLAVGTGINKGYGYSYGAYGYGDGVLEGVYSYSITVYDGDNNFLNVFTQLDNTSSDPIQTFTYTASQNWIDAQVHNVGHYNTSLQFYVSSVNLGQLQSLPNILTTSS